MKFSKLIGLIIVLLPLSALTEAHPGGTASDGCHYCRTNCESWGEIKGARHCHNGYQKAESQPEKLIGEVDVHQAEHSHPHTHDALPAKEQPQEKL
jgi:hypothetical protein